ncbi:MAG: hypothetical protein ACOX8V_07410 [Thermoleophilia bacterium]|jgi:hypothetical protein
MQVDLIYPWLGYGGGDGKSAVKIPLGIMGDNVDEPVTIMYKEDQNPPYADWPVVSLADQKYNSKAGSAVLTDKIWVNTENPVFAHFTGSSNDDGYPNYVYDTDGTEVTP